MPRAHKGQQSIKKVVKNKHDPGRRRVVQISKKNGKEIGTFESHEDAAKKTGVKRTSISKVCRGEASTAGEDDKGNRFTWKNIDPDQQRDFVAKGGTYQPGNAVVQRYRHNRKIIARFASLTAAMKATGVERHLISDVIKGTRVFAGDDEIGQFIWTSK